MFSLGTTIVGEPGCYVIPNEGGIHVSGLGTDVSSQVGGSVNPRTLQTYPVRTTFTRSRTSVVKPGGMGSRRRMRSTDEVTTTSTTATTATVIILTHVEKGIWIAVRF